MVTFYGRFALLLILPLAVCTALAVLIAPQDNAALDDLRAFLRDPACEPFLDRPCWLGIRPQVTTMGEALSLLLRHDWISAPYVDQGFIAWEWSAAAPEFLRTAAGPNFVYFNVETGVVTYIYLYDLDLPLGDYWRVMGDPGSLWTRDVNDSAAGRRVNYASFHETPLIGAVASADCPISPLTFWSGRVDVLAFREPETTREPVPINWREIYLSPYRCR